MKKSKTKERIYTVAFMLAVTIVTVSAVSGLHLATNDIVRRNADLFRCRAVLRAAQIAIPSSPAEVAATYERLVKPVPGIPDCYTVGPEMRKCVFLRTGPGLWGDITAAVCFDTETESIVGVTFTEHNETPGLGGRIEEKWFQQQFIGKRTPLTLLPEGTESESRNEVDAITGATITSSAVRDIVNRSAIEAADMAVRLRRDAE